MNLRPQDILVMLKLAASDRPSCNQLDLANALLLSPSEVSNSLQRAAYADLFVHNDRKAKRLGRIGTVRKNGLCEFVIHGLRYVFPARLGEIAVGKPTAWGAPPLSNTIVAGSDGIPIWPDAEGTQRGIAVRPLYETVPHAASQDADLYELLALIDAIRIGGARERALATDLLRKKLVVP